MSKSCWKVSFLLIFVLFAFSLLLDQVLQQVPHDFTAQRYRNHCLEYLTKGTPADWTGIESIEQK